MCAFKSWKKRPINAVIILTDNKKEHYPCKANKTYLPVGDSVESQRRSVFSVSWRAHASSHKRTRIGQAHERPKVARRPWFFDLSETCNYVNSASISISKCRARRKQRRACRRAWLSPSRGRRAEASDHQRVCSRQKLKVFRFSRGEAENARSTYLANWSLIRFSAAVAAITIVQKSLFAIRNRLAIHFLGRKQFRRRWFQWREIARRYLFGGTCLNN